MTMLRDLLVSGEIGDVLDQFADYILTDRNFKLNEMQIALQKHFMAVARPNSTEYGYFATCSKYMWYRDLHDEKGNYDLVLELNTDSIGVARYAVTSRADLHSPLEEFLTWEYSDPGLFDGVEKILLGVKRDLK